MFVFISGFLFNHIYIPKFNYQKFLMVRTKNIFVPIFSFQPYSFSYSYLKWHVIEGLPVLEKTSRDIILPYLEDLWTGGPLMGYWYIPVILITFLMAPIHVVHARADPPTDSTLVYSFCLSFHALVHRPLETNEVPQAQSALYFLPIYLLGITCSANKEKFWTFLKGKEVIFLIGGLLLAALQAMLYDWYGSYHKHPFSLTTIDLNLFQKIFISLFFLVFLHRFEH